MHTLAITGATGQVGREVACFLQNASIPNRLLVRNLIKAKFLQHPTSTLIHFDYRNTRTYEPALKDVKRIFLVFDSSLESQYLASLIDVAFQMGVEGIVAISGIGANLSPRHCLAHLDEIVRTSKVPSVILRVNWFFQNFGTQFVDMVRKEHVLTFPDGGKALSFVDLRDIAEVAFHFLKKECFGNHSEYEITGGESLTHAEIAQIFSKHLPYFVHYKEISSAEAKDRLGWDEDLLSLFEDIRAGIGSQTSDSIHRLLGRKPRSFENYVTENKTLWI